MPNIVVNVSSSGDNTVIAGIAGQTIYIFGIFLQCGAANTLTFKDGATALTGPMHFTAGGGINLFSGNAIFTLNPGDSFVINASSLVPEIGGFISYGQS